jgi:hypothetical protein
MNERICVQGPYNYPQLRALLEVPYYNDLQKLLLHSYQVTRILDTDQDEAIHHKEVESMVALLPELPNGYMLIYQLANDYFYTCLHEEVGMPDFVPPEVIETDQEREQRELREEVEFHLKRLALEKEWETASRKTAVILECGCTTECCCSDTDSEEEPSP